MQEPSEGRGAGVTLQPLAASRYVLGQDTPFPLYQFRAYSCLYEKKLVLKRLRRALGKEQGHQNRTHLSNISRVFRGIFLVQTSLEL